MVTIIGSTSREQVRDFERQMAALGGNVARGAQFAINGVAIDLRMRQRRVIESEVDDPTAWTKNALAVRLGRVSEAQNLSVITAAVAVKEHQSIPLKFLFGERTMSGGRVAAKVAPAR